MTSKSPKDQYAEQVAEEESDLGEAAERDLRK